MNNSYISQIHLEDLKLWGKKEPKRSLPFFTLETTARCNNNCRHCLINKPAEDPAVKGKELSFTDLKEIVNEAIHLNALHCLLTGGEPLLRNDFLDLYLYLKEKGILVSLFTNAALIEKEHIRLFQRYPPSKVEVTVYGVTAEIYDRVTRRPGSFVDFQMGLGRLLAGKVPVRLKAMVLNSNVHELPDIVQFCRNRAPNGFRFDPFLKLRYDGDPMRNEEIKSERLSPADIVGIERADSDRSKILQKCWRKILLPTSSSVAGIPLFTCGLGQRSFTIGPNGHLRLCSSLCHPDFVFNLKNGSLIEGIKKLVRRAQERRSSKGEFLEKCGACPNMNFCMWCPAHSYLETGSLEGHVNYFCDVAYARVRALADRERLENGTKPANQKLTSNESMLFSSGKKS